MMELSEEEKHLALLDAACDVFQRMKPRHRVNGTIQEAENLFYDFCAFYNISNRPPHLHLSKFDYESRITKPVAQYCLRFNETRVGIVEIVQFDKALSDIEIRPLAQECNDFISNLSDIFYLWRKLESGLDVSDAVLIAMKESVQNGLLLCEANEA